MSTKNKNLKMLKLNFIQNKAKNQFSLDILNMDIESVSEHIETLIFSISLVIFIVIAVVDMFIFIYNIHLKNEYNSRLLALKTYQNQMNTLNKRVNIIKGEYNRLNDKIIDFKYENDIFDRYYNYYSNLYQLTNLILSNFDKKNTYIKSVDIRISPNNTNPTSINVSISTNTPENVNDIFASFPYKNGCYDFGIKNICINSIVQNNKIRINKSNFVYFENNFELKGILKGVEHVK